MSSTTDKQDETTVEEKEMLDQVLADSHDNILPTRKLIVVFFGLALSLFLAFVDQTGITVALPHIAEELNAQQTISWAGTASLISNTVFMVLFGRFSDIFSRKYVLLASMAMLSMFDLACGFAQNAVQLFVFRAFCGIGVGGITSLSMVIVSDVVTLADRGRYQGILGSCVGLGNALGPFLASAFISRTSSWRVFYYVLSPLVALSMGMVWWLVPYTHHRSAVWSKLTHIDYGGLVVSATGIVLVLVPLSGGGSSFAWDSALVITMFTVGGMALIFFPLVEVFWAELPLVPMHLFATRLSLTVLLSQNFFFGMCYYGLIFFAPYYLEVVRGFSVLRASTLMLCLVIPQVTVSIVSGQLISRYKHYLAIVWFGYGSWTLGTALLTALWSVDSPTVKIAVPLVFVGMGVGATFQPTLVAAQAQSFHKDRAIVISTRNFLRSFGGAVGLAVANTILANSFTKALKSNRAGSLFSEKELFELKTHIFSSQVTYMGLSPDQVDFIKSAYMSGLKNIVYFWTASIAYCLVSTITVSDSGLAPIDSLK